jgi:ribosomal protein L37E
MAYVECARCGLTAYTAACWSTIDHCVRCGAPLPHRARNVTPIARHPRFVPKRTGRPVATGPREQPPAA